MLLFSAIHIELPDGLNPGVRVCLAQGSRYRSTDCTRLSALHIPTI